MATTAPVKETASENACPRCAKPLTDAAGLGWCPACGYCKSLEEDPAKKLLPTAPVKPGPTAMAVQEAKQAVLRLPMWFYLLLVGMLVIGAATIWQGTRLPAEGLTRALWTTVLMGVGLLIIFFGQIIVLVRVAADDPQITFKDMFFPFRVWGHAFKKLTTLHRPFMAATWGLTLTLSACVFIGGLGHWATYLPGAKDPAKLKDTKKR